MRTGPAEPAAERGYVPLLLLASSATFLAVLDVTIVNLAIPDLHKDFQDSAVADLSWVITVYATLFAALLAPAGRLADVIGRRSLFTAGIAVFTAMSLACALAPNIPVLLTARALQGAGAAAMIPAALAIVLMDTPPERRRAAIGKWSAASAFAAAVGPSIGGVLVDTLGWRSLFLINVPFGLLLLLRAHIIPRAARPEGSRLPDPIGTILLGAGIGLLGLGISKGGDWGWGGAATLSCLAVGAAAMAITLLRSRTHSAPAVETGLWRSRTFALANLSVFFYGACLYAWLLVGVLYVTSVWHWSELKAGLAVTPGAVAATLVALYSGRIQTRYGPRTVVVAGAIVLAGTGFFLAFTLPDQPRFLTYWLPTGILAGAGMGAITTGTSTAAALSVSPPRFAAATGLNQTARQVGGAFGIATLATLLSRASADASDYGHVLLFCSIVTVLSGLAGLGLVIKAPPAAPQGQPARGSTSGAAQTAEAKPTTL
ncbi:DHA2 family efflux MFS transporter permease subunit [Streptomyces rhizosphaerihabitans]|uniref:DHA2 family efflux MFS transporter permease subunit n=1 Tax=Streptomyces rhizosphaerihabitans TaxID=1266770 RepID=UPI0021C0A0EC|nr:DHA2 family efflux MFS transporter permease subunit [Streptomyces rhizosphaerihabitans]MCT9007766.1 DHA2 family efflux MFS transporter permease subunit [Streptomyces rhizosphaerihabitans]